MYRSLVWGLHASGGRVSFAASQCSGKNSAALFRARPLGLVDGGRPVFESIDVNTLLLENGKSVQEGETIAIQYPR